jgi:hypothetical protein
VQHHFPANFGLGPNRLLTDASPRRIAQQKQLQGYLLLFEQVLANLFSQAAEAASLYSFTDAAPTTYFSQPLLDRIPGIGALLNPEVAVEGLRAGSAGTWCFDPGVVRPELNSTINLSGPFAQVNDAKVLESNDIVVRVAPSSGSVLPAGPHTWSYSPAYLQAQLQDITEKGNTGLTRKNKFLNHVMARFGEQMTEYTLLLNHLDADGNSAATQAISDKLNFLRDYPRISADRAGAIDYLRPYDAPDNLPGFMRRVMRMLGIAQPQIAGLADGPITWLKANFIPEPGITWAEIWAFAADPLNYRIDSGGKSFDLARSPSDPEVIAHSPTHDAGQDLPALIDELVRVRAALAAGTEGLHIVEHVLLRPRAKDPATGLYVLFREKHIHKAERHPSIGAGYICHCPAHGLTPNSEVLLRRTNGKDLRRKPIEITPDTFVLIISSNLSDADLPEFFVPIDYPEDPYSLQMTVMLPAWPQRNQDENFRRLVEKTIRSEAPAHLKVYLQWLDLDHMHEFEHCHFTWLAHLHHAQ